MLAHVRQMFNTPTRARSSGADSEKVIAHAEQMKEATGSPSRF